MVWIPFALLNLCSDDRGQEEKIKDIFLEVKEHTRLNYVPTGVSGHD